MSNLTQDELAAMRREIARMKTLMEQAKEDRQPFAYIKYNNRKIELEETIKSNIPF